MLSAQANLGSLAREHETELRAQRAQVEMVLADGPSSREGEILPPHPRSRDASKLAEVVPGTHSHYIVLARYAGAAPPSRLRTSSRRRRPILAACTNRRR